MKDETAVSEHVHDEYAETGPENDTGTGQETDGTDGGDAVETTGHPQVDAVVASLRDLDHRPVDEHVAVFEAAHDRLRGALADAGNDPAGN